MIRFNSEEWTVASWRQVPVHMDEDVEGTDDGREPLWQDLVAASAVVALLWTTAMVFLR